MRVFRRTCGDLGSLYTIQKIRLNSKLNEEYGKEIKGK